MVDAAVKADRELEKELSRQIGLCYGSIALALHNMGWGTKKIQNIFERTYMNWTKCGEDNDRSMLHMVEDETGIEIQTESGKSWHDLRYLNGQDAHIRSKLEYVVMRQRQKEWIAPVVVGCFVYSLHRRYGYGKDRIVRILDEANAIKEYYGYDPDKLRKACADELQIKFVQRGVAKS